MARNGAVVRIGLGVVFAVAASTAWAYVEVQSQPAPPNVTAMAYSPEFGMLAMNTGDTMSFVRLVDELQYGFQPFAQKYTGLSLSPSGRYLYLADYGGESNGAPSGTSWVHRYDLATGYNELKTAWIAAGNVQAVSDTRFILTSLAQPVTFTHNDWGSASAVVPINTPSSPPAPGYAAHAYPGDMRSCRRDAAGDLRQRQPRAAGNRGVPDRRQ